MGLVAHGGWHRAGSGGGAGWAGGWIVLLHMAAGTALEAAVGLDGREGWIVLLHMADGTTPYMRNLLGWPETRLARIALNQLK